MRAAAILGLGCSPKDLKPFQAPLAGKIEWRIGMPASGDQADAILVFGGDGTIHRHLGQLVKLGLPVLVVPAGSGNDFARALGLRRVRDALGAWQKFSSGAGSVRHIDLGVITPLNHATLNPEVARDSGLGTRYFCCVAGVGLDCEVSRRANQLPRWLRGHGGYALTLIPMIFRFAPLPIKIQTADESPGKAPNQGWTTRSDQPTLLAAFANAPVYGGGMKIAPQAKMDDGLLDICVVGGVDPFKLFCMFPTVYYGRHLSIREVDYFQAARVHIETQRPLDVYADGEYVCRTPVEVAIQPSALRVIVHLSQTSS
jgi:diacylglycerol kinase (ATP)